MLQGAPRWELLCGLRPHHDAQPCSLHPQKFTADVPNPQGGELLRAAGSLPVRKEESSAPHLLGSLGLLGLVGAGDQSGCALVSPAGASVGLDLSSLTYAKQARKEFLPFPESGL